MALHRRIGLMIGLLCLCMAGGALAAEAAVVQIAPDEGLLNQGLLEVHFINVDAADCLLLRLGDKTLMLDSGTRATSDRVLAYLAEVGVDALDYAFATHPHDDHVGGFLDLLPVIPVDTFLAPHLYEEDEASSTRLIRRALQEAGLPITYIENESTLNFGGATLTFYQWQKKSETGNNRSMIALLRYGQRSMLLAADIGSQAQHALTELYGDRLRADIIKLPHHGLSTYQLAFHRVVQAELATFSNVRTQVKDNISRLKDRKVPYLFTPQGSIVAVTDGEVWQVYQTPNKKK
ncbi:MAG: MBL fold metallo-hydrolase [Oscillospiraceae bacterium]|nr:MBL fold metallo-hydrolase [Oscillospiraceae bacterium]